MTSNVLPAWLEAPPERLERPPVRPRAQGLPFEELDWLNFERLILRVVRADRAITDCQVYGTPGQAQHGIDLLAVLVSAPADKGCFQCKRVDSFGAPDVKKAVTKFEKGRWAEQAQEFTLCVASALESTEVAEAITQERRRLAERGIRFAVWDGSKAGDLNVRLKGLPEIVDVCSAVIHVVHDFVGFTTPATASPGPTRANIRDATRPLPLARARAHPPPIHVGT